MRERGGGQHVNLQHVRVWGGGRVLQARMWRQEGRCASSQHPPLPVGNPTPVPSALPQPAFPPAPARRLGHASANANALDASTPFRPPPAGTCAFGSSGGGQAPCSGKPGQGRGGAGRGGKPLSLQQAQQHLAQGILPCHSIAVSVMGRRSNGASRAPLLTHMRMHTHSRACMRACIAHRQPAAARALLP